MRNVRAAVEKVATAADAAGFHVDPFFGHEYASLTLTRDGQRVKVVFAARNPVTGYLCFRSAKVWQGQEQEPHDDEAELVWSMRELLGRVLVPAGEEEPAGEES